MFDLASRPGPSSTPALATRRQVLAKLSSVRIHKRGIVSAGPQGSRTLLIDTRARDLRMWMTRTRMMSVILARMPGLQRDRVR